MSEATVAGEFRKEPGQRPDWVQFDPRQPK